MRGITYFINSATKAFFFGLVTKAFFFPPSQTTSKRYCIVSKETPLPYLVLESINDLRLGRGWVWKGEYYSLLSEPLTVEVLLYTANGSLRITQIDKTGKVMSLPCEEEEEYQFYIKMQQSNYNPS